MYSESPIRGWRNRVSRYKTKQFFVLNTKRSHISRIKHKIKKQKANIYYSTQNLSRIQGDNQKFPKPP